MICTDKWVLFDFVYNGSCYFGRAIIAGDFDYTVGKTIVTWENSLLLYHEYKLLYHDINHTPFISQYKPFINRWYEDEPTL